MIRTTLRRYRAAACLSGLLASAGIAACSAHDATGPGSDPLSGLVRSQAKDQGGSPADTAAPTGSVQNNGPGFFQGRVVGYTSTATDTVLDSQGLPGVTVSAYAQGSDGRAAGGALATTVSDASGGWTLPQVPGGSYVVTFVPAATSPYQGTWTVAYASPQSGTRAWWIMLPHK